MDPLDQVIHAIKEWQARKPGYDTFRNYYDGRHQLRFATKDFAQKYGDQVQSLRENMCPAVVSAFTDRLEVASWGDNASLEVAESEGLSRLLALIFDESFRAGDAYALVWPGPDGKPVAHYHRADQIVPHVNPEDPNVLDWAAKIWITPDKHARVNIYDDTQVTRWITAIPVPDGNASSVPKHPSAWREHEDEDGHTISHAFGSVPVCWFPQGADTQGGYGVSILNDAIPLQDGLNKSVADLVISSEAYARPFWYLLNYKPDDTNPLLAAGQFMDALRKAAVGTMRKFKPNEQQIFTHDGPGPFGQLEPADAEKLVRIQDAWALKMGRVLGIPPYYIAQTTGDVPSGQSLRVLTSRMVARVRRFQRANTPVLRGLAQLLGIKNPSITWEPPVALDETERWQIAQIKQGLGISLTDILADAGATDIEGIVERAEAAQARSASAVGKALRDGDITF